MKIKGEFSPSTPKSGLGFANIFFYSNLHPSKVTGIFKKDFSKVSQRHLQFLKKISIKISHSKEFNWAQKKNIEWGFLGLGCEVSLELQANNHGPKAVFSQTKHVSQTSFPFQFQEVTDLTLHLLNIQNKPCFVDCALIQAMNLFLTIQSSSSDKSNYFGRYFLTHSS